jgi:hypothetical protein
MTLHWSSSSGGYNPSKAFKIQEKRVFENILSHNNIPSSIEKPKLLVRQHLQFICSDFALRNYEAKIHHKEKPTNSCVKEEGKEEEDCIFEDNGSFQDDDEGKPPNPTNAPNTTPNTTFNTTDTPPSHANPVASPASHIAKKQRTKGRVCSFFNYDHPSERICQWYRSYNRRTTPIVYNPPVTEFQFCLEDMEKIENEDPEITKKINKEDKPQSDYSSSTSSSTTLGSAMSYISQSGKKKFKKDLPMRTISIGLAHYTPMNGRRTPIGKNTAYQRK